MSAKASKSRPLFLSVWLRVYAVLDNRETKQRGGGLQSFTRYKRMRSSSSSFRRSSPKLSNCSRAFDLLDDLEADYAVGEAVGGAMLPMFLEDLRRNNDHDTVEVTLELQDDSVVVCSVMPTTDTAEAATEGFLGRSHSVTSRIRKKFPWLRSPSCSQTSMSDAEENNTISLSARDARRMKARLQRTRSTAQQALKGLRFISKSTTSGACEAEELWRKVETRFESLAEDDLLAREDFGECIGTVTRPH